MQLIDVDKARYKKHLNVVIIGFISSLLVLSLGFGAILIALFSSVGEVTQLGSLSEAPPESNFRLNLLGVILALLANAAILHSIKRSDYFTEIYYVWQRKQIQNLIYRKLTKIKAAAKENDTQALVILSYYYHSIKQLYVLDDNTITLSTVERDLQKVTDTIAEQGIDVTATPFDKKMLADY